jgi:DNA ligase-1
MLYPTLYKQDSKGKVREWRMERHGNQYRTIAGLQDGDQVTSDWTEVHGKNIGRANETSAEEQAALEVEAKYTKKKKTSYHETIDTIETAVIFEPMLAQPLEKREGKIKWGVETTFVQPKLDGIRCIAKADGLWSRTGTPITALPFLWESLQPLFEEDPGLVLDGELYNHELKHDFGEIVSMVRKKDPTPDEIALAENMVEYHVYDIPCEDCFDRPFSYRHEVLQELIRAYNIKYLKGVDTIEVKSREEWDEIYGQQLEAGYEGGMLRLDTPYKHKRQNSLVKRKDFEDDEFIITRIEEGQGNWAGLAKRVFFTNNMGEKGEVGAGLKGSKAYAKHVLDNRDDYVGKEVTIKFFGRSKDDLVPRFPIAKRLHEDKRW